MSRIPSKDRYPESIPNNGHSIRTGGRPQRDVYHHREVEGIGNEFPHGCEREFARYTIGELGNENSSVSGGGVDEHLKLIRSSTPDEDLASERPFIP